MTTTTPGIQLKPGEQPRLAAGSWRVDPAHSLASFTARVAGHTVRGRLPLTGKVLITEPIEDSTARLAAAPAPGGMPRLVNIAMNCAVRLELTP